VLCTCTLFRLSLALLFLPIYLFYSAFESEFSPSFSFSRSHIPKLRILKQSKRRNAGRLPVHLGRTRDRFFSATQAFTHGASMKITYAVMPIDGPVQSTDSGGTSAARAVKITLKNLKRWCEKRLRHRTVARDFKNNRDNQLRGKIPYDENIMMTMIIDQEELRNRANENLENELRESLAINDQSKLHCTNFDNDCQLEFNDLAEDDEPPIRDLSRMEVITRVLRGLEGSFRSP